METLASHAARNDPRRGGHFLPLALGILATWVLSGWVFLRFSHPLAFRADHLFLLLHGRLFLDWPHILTNAHLGFPGQIDLLAFPFTDITQRIIQAAVTVATGRVVAGAHLYTAAIMAANYAAAYVALYLFMRRRLDAAFGALAFALLPFAIARIGNHDYLAACYPAPLAFVLLHRVADLSRGGAPLRRLARDPVTWACTALVASSGFYFSMFALLVLAYGGTGLALLRLDRRPLLLALAAAGALAAGLAMILAPFVVQEMREGLQFPPRLAEEQARYGTRISDILRLLDPFSMTGLRNYRALSDQAEGADFWPGPVLTVVALLAALFAPMLAGRAVVPGTGAAPLARGDLVRLMAGLLVVFLLVSVPYGLGMVFNVTVSPLLRAQNRIAPFFGFAAIVLALWAWRGPRSWLRRRLGAARGDVAASGALALLVLLNSGVAIGALPRRQQAMLRNPQYREEIASVDALLAAAERSGARHVLQMPILGWPEQPAQRAFDSYGHLRPYIRSQPGSAWRWSYGLTTQAPDFARLMMAERGGSREGLARRAACLGFDALLIEQRAYSEEDAAAWDRALREGGGLPVHEDRLRRLYSLPPAAGCAESLLPRGEWLDVNASTIAAGLLGPGWYPAEPSMAWGAGTRHVLRIPVAGWQADDLRIDALAWVLPGRGNWQRQVRISAGGEALGTWRFDQHANPAEQSVVIPRRLLPPHGILTLEFTPSAALTPAEAGIGPDTRVLGLGLIRLRFTPVQGG